MKTNVVAGAVALALSVCLSSATAALITGPAGAGQPLDNMQPSLGLNYIVKTDGVFNNVGEIRMFAGNFAPGGFQIANGQLLPIDQYESLFNHIGTTYGGDGQSNFALPDLRGRAPVHYGTGPGLTNRALGEVFGSEAVTLSGANLPAHNHSLPPSALTTGVTGGGQPYSTMQPSLGLNYTIALQGIFPSRTGGSNAETMLGQIKLRAGTLLPNGEAEANGQLLPINQNQALFALLGTNYGGDGRTNFALPDLRGRALLGTGTGPGLSPRSVGERVGAENTTLAVSNLPPHSHSLPPTADSTGVTGGGQPHSTMQPSLGLSYIIATQGIFPSRDGSGDVDTMVGEVRMFAGDFAPSGFAFADGSVLSIAQNTALFSLLGTTYGGNGQTTFALPDLRGRLALQAGQGPGLTDRLLGEMMGAESVTLGEAGMPTHTHTFVPEPSSPLLIGIAVAGMALRRRRRSGEVA